MCSFLFTNKEKINLEDANYLIKKRGPDLTNILRDCDKTYVHNLLSITGSFNPQPIFKDDLVLLYNGEIYNYLDFGSYSSDGECILDLFTNFGVKAFEKLDGEFSIFINDKKNSRLYLCTDTFGTKPLYYSIEDNEIGVSSYPEALLKLGFSSSKRCQPNSILVIKYPDLSIENTFMLYDFKLDQFKNQYSDWILAFEESIKKRAFSDKHRILLPLSSGYDSGAISCCLNILDVDYVSYSIVGKENRSILNSRISINKNSDKEIIECLDDSKINEIKLKFEKDVQPFYYGPNPDEITHFGFEDPGAIGLYHILDSAKNKYNTKIVLSGQGSDEIMNNIQTYGFKTKNPERFTDSLKEIFPWGNFFYGSQWSYLMKEECIAGSLGIETRYPFLDRNLVQEYLHLSPDLKNKSYKSPLNEYMSKNSYPFIEEKIGFNIK
jgi:asparagine synthase (glutamine-hydrolysing)